MGGPCLFTVFSARPYLGQVALENVEELGGHGAEEQVNGHRIHSLTGERGGGKEGGRDIRT